MIPAFHVFSFAKQHFKAFLWPSLRKLFDVMMQFFVVMCAKKFLSIFWPLVWRRRFVLEHVIRSSLSFIFRSLRFIILRELVLVPASKILLAINLKILFCCYFDHLTLTKKEHCWKVSFYCAVMWPQEVVVFVLSLLQNS